MSDRPDNYTADEVIRRGTEAERLLGHPLMVEAFERADIDFVREWRESTNPQKREAAWYKIQALIALRGILESIINDGEFERIAREREQRN